MVWLSVRAAIGTAVVAAAFLLTACKKETGSDQTRVTNTTLEGTVTFNGERVSYALVIVVGDNMSATGKIGDNGRYKVENCPVGEVQVAVNTEAGRGDHMSAVQQAMAAKKSVPKFIEVPPAYHDPTSTPLRFTTKPGANTFDIVIPK